MEYKNQTPFPHVLTPPKQSNKNLFRFVTDEDVDAGGVIKEYSRRQNNPESDEVEAVYDIFKISDIKEKRKAKGDWSNWGLTPTYYKATGSYLGAQFESNLGTDVFLK